MKTRLLGRSTFWASIAGLAIAGMLTLSACDKDHDDDDDKYKISGDASGAQEVPPVTTAGTGTLSGTYNARSKTLTYTINWTGLSGEATAAHFHGPAAVDETAPPLQDIAITTNGTTGSATGTVTASTELHDALLAGKVYYNVHTADFPDGEIRAQVKLKEWD